MTKLSSFTIFTFSLLLMLIAPAPFTKIYAQGDKQPSQISEKQVDKIKQSNNKQNKKDAKLSNSPTLQNTDLPNTPLPYNYSPNYCDFIASFPTPALITHHCENKNKPEDCFDRASYTKVFDLSSTIRIEIICNPATPEMFAYFTKPIMEKTVKAMTRKSVIDTYQVNSSETDKYKLAGLIGKGRKGLDDTLYIAQLWISQNSIMSVEAEMSGKQQDQVDKSFANILRNIGFIAEIKGEEYAAKKLKERKEQEASKQIKDASKAKALSQDKK